MLFNLDDIDLPLGTLRINIVRGSNLAPMDGNGFSDPYVTVTACNTKTMTPIQWKTLEPVWNHDFEFEVFSPMDVVDIVMKDKDRFSSDDFMGGLSLTVSQIETFMNKSVSFPMETGGSLTIEFELKYKFWTRIGACLIASYREYLEIFESKAQKKYIPSFFDPVSLSATSIKFFTIATPYFIFLELALQTLRWKTPVLSGTVFIGILFALYFPKIVFLGTIVGLIAILKFTENIYSKEREVKPLEGEKFQIAKTEIMESNDLSKINTVDTSMRRSTFFFSTSIEEETVKQTSESSTEAATTVTQKLPVAEPLTKEKIPTEQPVAEKQDTKKPASENATAEKASDDDVSLLSSESMPLPVQATPSFIGRLLRRNPSAAQPTQPGIDETKISSSMDVLKEYNSMPVLDSAPLIATQSSPGHSHSHIPAKEPLRSPKPSRPGSTRKKRVQAPAVTNPAGFEEQLHKINTCNEPKILASMTGKWFRSILNLVHGILVFLIEAMENIEKVITWQDKDFTRAWIHRLIAAFIVCAIIPLYMTFGIAVLYLFSLSTDLYFAYRVCARACKYLAMFLHTLFLNWRHKPKPVQSENFDCCASENKKEQ